MNIVLDYMLIIFGTPEYDWMGFKITEDNPITYHHIRKYNDGGAETVENGAILSILSHRYLHQIELIDLDIYNSINRVLKRINESRKNATEKDYEEILKYLEQYESTYSKEINTHINKLNINIKLLSRVMPDYKIITPSDFRIILQNGINPVLPKKKIKKCRKYQ